MDWQPVPANGLFTVEGFAFSGGGTDGHAACLSNPRHPRA